MFQLTVIKCCTVAVFFASLLILQPAFALDMRALPGKWHGDDGKEYEVQIQGNRFIVFAPNKKGIRQPFSGPLVPQGEFPIQYQPKAEEYSALPPQTIQGLVSKGYSFRGNAAIQPNGNIKLTFIVDNVVYKENNPADIRVEPDMGTREVVLSHTSGYKIGSLNIDDTRFNYRVAGQVAQLEREIQSIIDNKLPGLNTEINHQKGNLDEINLRRTTYETQVSSIDQDIQKAQVQLQTMTSHLKQSPEWTQKQALGKNIRDLENLILKPSGPSEQARLDQALEALRARSQELEAVNRKLSAELQKK